MAKSRRISQRVAGYPDGSYYRSGRIDRHRRCRFG